MSKQGGFPATWWRWDGEAQAMRPVTRGVTGWFVDGQVYRLEPREERSSAQHRWYFASINEAWKNLPDDLAERFPSADHLRRWALVRAGYADQEHIVLDSERDAKVVASFIRQREKYAVIRVSGNVLQVFTPHSQKERLMKAAVFKQSVEDVMKVVAGLIGVTPGELRKHGEKAETDGEAAVHTN